MDVYDFETVDLDRELVETFIENIDPEDLESAAKGSDRDTVRQLTELCRDVEDRRKENACWDAHATISEKRARLEKALNQEDGAIPSRQTISEAKDILLAIGETDAVVDDDKFVHVGNKSAKIASHFDDLDTEEGIRLKEPIDLKIDGEVVYYEQMTEDDIGEVLLDKK